MISIVLCLPTHHTLRLCHEFSAQFIYWTNKYRNQNYNQSNDFFLKINIKKLNNQQRYDIDDIQKKSKRSMPSTNSIENYHGSNTVFLVGVLMSVVGFVFVTFTLMALCYRSVVVHRNFSLCLRLVERNDKKQRKTKTEN